MNRADLLSAIVRITGLDRATVRNLLKEGWTYSEHDDVPRFTAPEKKGR